MDIFQPFLQALQYLKLKLVISILRYLTPTPKPSNPDIAPSTTYIPSRTGTHLIKANIYSSPSSPVGPSPVLINMHGSGFVIPLHGSDSAWCTSITSRTPITVLDIDYRKAPEHPFPAALRDLEDAIQYVLSQPKQFDSGRIALSGFSAGANLSLAASSSSSFGKFGKGKDVIKAVLAFYPPCDLVTQPEEKKAPKPLKPIPDFVARIFNESYLLGGVNPMDPRISIGLAAEEYFPANVMIISCEGDNLCGEAEALAEKLARGRGRNLVARRMDGVGHGWDKKVVDGTLEGTWESKRRDEAYGLGIDMLRETIAGDR